MDRLRLIAEVRQRPILWDSQRLDRSRREITNQWQDVASSMGANVSVSDCRSMWNHLRNAYREGKKRCGQRISKDKVMGSYDPENKYYANTYEYAKQMNFLENIGKTKKNYEIKFQHDSETKELHLFSIRSTSPTRQESEAKSCSSDNEHTQFMYDDTDTVRIKPEPFNEIEMETYNMDHDENISENSNILNKRTKDEDEFISIPIKENNNFTAEPSAKDFINDPDYNFLISFSSHMKLMTPLQNLLFRNKMSDLIFSFLKSSNFVTETAKSVNNIQLKAFVDVRDSDSNFLISYWLYMKMLSTLENLQLRSKISALMLNISSINDN
ncbi:hypothetical protein CVS40_3853 [Lucilia cuprina]|nr:hypothetical protein CVS40_3853 [Lucilia cuprina]